MILGQIQEAPMFLKKEMVVLSLVVKLDADDASPGQNFGSAVAISGDSIVVGARLDNEISTDSGSAYVFTRGSSTWSQQAKLLASDGAIFDQFGYSVAISGDSVVVGTHLDDNGSLLSGNAYVFTRSDTSWMRNRPS